MGAGIYWKLLKKVMIRASFSPKRTVPEDQHPADRSMQAVALRAVLHLPYRPGMFQGGSQICAWCKKQEAHTCSKPSLCFLQDEASPSLTCCFLQLFLGFGPQAVNLTRRGIMPASLK